MAATTSSRDSASTAAPPMRSRLRGLFHRPPVPFNIPAAVLVIAGTVLQLIAIANATWLSTSSGRLVFTGMHEWAKPGYAAAYFSWLAIVLVVLTAAFGALACWHWRAAGVFRYIGAVLGVLGIFMSVGAVLVLAYQTDNEAFHIVRNYSAGIYFAVIGLLLTALGAAGGSGRRG